jgi:hypothetical protein
LHVLLSTAAITNPAHLLLVANQCSSQCCLLHCIQPPLFLKCCFLCSSTLSLLSSDSSVHLLYGQGLCSLNCRLQILLGSSQRSLLLLRQLSMPGAEVGVEGLKACSSMGLQWKHRTNTSQQEDRTVLLKGSRMHCSGCCQAHPAVSLV